MSDRKPVTKEKLLDILNNEMKKDPEYKDCKIDEIRKIPTKDPTDCNWSEIHIQHERCCIDSDGCRRFAFEIAKEAASKYNLK